MGEKVMQYVGARYVPKFADPIEWQENTTYEALTVVMYNNSSYTSKTPVPANVGIPAKNEKYWALTGNFNAQIEEYRQETEEIKADQSALNEKYETTKTELSNAIEKEVADRKALIYDNNGKADIPKGLSVEGKLSANDGAEISGTLKYGTPQLNENVESVPFVSTTGTEYNLLTSKNAQAHQLILGDSWVSLDEVDTHPARSKWYRDLLPYFPNMHNYAVKGSSFANLTSQVEEADADTSFINASVQTVVIVCGVNDYIQNIPVATAGENLNKALKTIYSLFPNANVVTLVDSYSPFSMYTGDTNYFNECWRYAMNLFEIATCPLYPLTPFLCFQKYFEKSGVASYHLSESGSKVLGTIISQIFNNQTPTWHERVSITQEVTLNYTKNGSTVTETVTSNPSYDIHCCGMKATYGFYIPISKELPEHSGTITFTINSNTDYEQAFPIISSNLELGGRFFNGGYNTFVMEGKTLKVYSTSTVYGGTVFSPMHAN